MGSIGVLFIILGFGSLILEQFNMEFKLLSWADDFQPWLGIGLGVVGVLLVLAGIVSKKNQENPPQH